MQLRDCQFYFLFFAYITKIQRFRGGIYNNNCHLSGTYHVLYPLLGFNFIPNKDIKSLILETWAPKLRDINLSLSQSHISYTSAQCNFLAYFFQLYSVMFYVVYDTYEQFCVLFYSIHISKHFFMSLNLLHKHIFQWLYNKEFIISIQIIKYSKERSNFLYF